MLGQLKTKSWFGCKWSERGARASQFTRQLSFPICTVGWTVPPAGPAAGRNGHSISLEDISGLFLLCPELLAILLFLRL